MHSFGIKGLHCGVSGPIEWYIVTFLLKKPHLQPCHMFGIDKSYVPFLVGSKNKALSWANIGEHSVRITSGSH